MVPYSKHEVVSAHRSNGSEYYHQNGHAAAVPNGHALTNGGGPHHISNGIANGVVPNPHTVLPPIDYATPRNFPMSPQLRSKYVLDPAASPAVDASNLPAILQSSLGKLEMNFVQNKSLDGQPLELAHDERRQLEYHNGERALVPSNGTAVRPAGGGSEPEQQLHKAAANGVLKVAMYGEFPITTSAATITKTNQA